MARHLGCLWVAEKGVIISVISSNKVGPCGRRQPVVVSRAWWFFPLEAFSLKDTTKVRCCHYDVAAVAGQTHKVMFYLPSAWMPWKEHAVRAYREEVNRHFWSGTFEWPIFT